MERIDPVCGEWTYGYPFYSSSLSINKDSTFAFFSQGCLGRGYTEGKWIKNKGYLILTSFDSYKISRPDSDTSNYYFHKAMYELKDHGLVDVSNGQSDQTVYKKFTYR